MYLEKIEIQGFKSFANASELVFNRELTAIVGPNGSGKSNVADAIRWVLGEQSMKLLRGKKSEDVIFAGSDTKGKLGFARVALHLNNKEKRADIDYEELVIERTIQRSGESEYKLNGSKVRLTDIQLLLARASVGQKSYSVIGQGMIDSLLTLSAQERRDFFDEATGVKQYQIKKQQALLKLEHTEENLQQAELVLQELEPRLRTLTRQVKRLEKKEELEKELRKAQEQYYGFLKTDIDTNLESLSKKRENSEKHIDDLNKKLLDIQQKVDEYGHGQSRTADYNSLQSKLFNVQQEYNNLTKKQIVLEGQKDVELIKQGDGQSVILQQRIAELKTRKQNTDAQLKDLTRQSRESSDLVSTLENKIKEISKKITSIESELENEGSIDWKTVEQDATILTTEHDQLMAELNSLEDGDSISDFKKKLGSFSHKLVNFFKQVKHNAQYDSKALWKSFSSLSAERDAIQKDLNNHSVRLQLNEQQASLLKQQNKDLEAEIKDLERNTLTDGSARQQSVAEDLKKIDDELKEKQKEMDTIRKDIEQFNASEEEKKTEIVELQKKSRTIQYDLGIKNNELTTLKVEVAKYETRKEDLEKEITIEAPGIDYKKVTSLNTGETRTSIENIKRQLNIIGGIDEETISEYTEVKEKHDYLSQQTTDLRKAQSQLIELIKDLDKQINKQFEAAFKNINTHFTKYFKKLFDGGSAKLNLTMIDHDEEESEDRGEEEGEQKEEVPLKHKKLSKQLNYSIEVTATPPGKKLSSVNVLSGGEKALTSIALVCAIIANNPPPFVVLDEVDAALDEANSIRFAEIISELTHETQFVTVTHNRATMHQAKILYGVTMGSDGISRLLSVNFEEADELSA